MARKTFLATLVAAVLVSAAVFQVRMTELQKWAVLAAVIPLAAVLAVLAAALQVAIVLAAIHLVAILQVRMTAF